MHIPRAVCTTCEVEMTTHKQGVTAEALLADGSGYYKIRVDKLRCPSCGIEILTGFARGPIAEHYETGYAAVIADTRFHFAGEL